tara:strand:+ start:3608 stop:4570 length:963 start_codon:yes stop_codon:yes gene_type:complete
LDNSCDLTNGGINAKTNIKNLYFVRFKDSNPTANFNCNLILKMLFCIFGKNIGFIFINQFNTLKMKKLIFILAVFGSTFINAQSVIETTFVEVPLAEIDTFIELHKKVTDMAQGEGRTIKGHWAYRHWYGSGASIVLYDQFDSKADAINDDFRAVYGANYAKLSEEAQKEMDAVFTEWWAYFDGHTDEMRTINYEKYYVSKDAVDWDIPYVFIVGHYNTSGSIADLADAYMDWQARPLVKEGLQLAGGASAHYKGAGSDAQFFSAFENLVDFATTASGQGSDNTAARDTFWSLVGEGHEDQIYIHVGHLVDGVFDLAGKE